MNRNFVQQFKRTPSVGYDVSVDGKSILITYDYLVAQGCALAWRRNHPREDKNRVWVSIVV